MINTESRALRASFRDPAGAVFSWAHRIFRIVNESGLEELRLFIESRSGQQLLESGSVSGTRLLSPAESTELQGEPAIGSLYSELGGVAILEHDRIPFASYPYEWSPGMLHAAGALTLTIARKLQEDGLGLKDATPYNVLFRGPNPVFVDVLSFERRDPGDSTWLPYAQFVRTFLLPLLANKHFGLPLDQILLNRRDGLEPEDVYRWTSFSQRLKAPFLSLVSIPKWLAGRHNPDDQTIYQRNVNVDKEKAAFILNSLFSRLGRALKKAAPEQQSQSVWTSYMTGNNNYSASDFGVKESFVQQTLSRLQPRRVLDVGCNTGHFSALAANAGASVVAVDYDPAVVDRVWRRAQSEGLDILPLTVNLTRPTPGIGWLNAECSSFLDRAAGQFDCVLMLAVIHHMLVTERIPLPGIIDLAASLTTDTVIIEFVAPEDSMFKRLTRGRDSLHKDLTKETFSRACERWFEVDECQRIEGTSRWLFTLRKKA